jgi:hypothetical protein
LYLCHLLLIEKRKRTIEKANRKFAPVRERAAFAQPTDSAGGGRAAEAGDARPRRNNKIRVLCGTVRRCACN